MTVFCCDPEALRNILWNLGGGRNTLTAPALWSPVEMALCGLCQDLPADHCIPPQTWAYSGHARAAKEHHTGIWEDPKTLLLGHRLHSWRLHPHDQNLFLKSPLVNTIAFGIRFQQMNFLVGRTKKFQSRAKMVTCEACFSQMASLTCILVGSGHMDNGAVFFQ
jgi:hypothetical protein